MAQIYEIKKARKWVKVKAESMQAISRHCKENGNLDWRLVGMQSRAEQLQNESLELVK